MSDGLQGGKNGALAGSMLELIADGELNPYLLERKQGGGGAKRSPALPEAVDLSKRVWEVRRAVEGKEYAPAYTDMKESRLIAPDLLHPLALRVRVHEIAHVALTPPEARRPSNMLLGELVDALEDARLHAALVRDPYLAKIMAEGSMLKRESSSKPWNARRKQLAREARHWRKHVPPEAEAAVSFAGALLMAATYACPEQKEVDVVVRACGTPVGPIRKIIRQRVGRKGATFQDTLDAAREIADLYRIPEDPEEEEGGKGFVPVPGDGEPADGDGLDLDLDADPSREELRGSGDLKGKPTGAEPEEAPPPTGGTGLGEAEDEVEAAARPKGEDGAKAIVAVAPDERKVLELVKAMNHLLKPEQTISKHLVGERESYGYEDDEDETRASCYVQPIARRSYTGGDPRIVWGPLYMRETELSEIMPPPVRQYVKRNRSRDDGGRLGQVHRLRLDGKVFRRKLRKDKPARGGSYLFDVSGSMHLSERDIERMLNVVPAATVAMYSGDWDRSRGSLWVLAQGGKRVAKIPEHGGANVVDGPALEWLARQEGPRVWVSDAVVTGMRSNGADFDRADAGRVREALMLCHKHEIINVQTIDLLLEKDTPYTRIEPLDERVRKVREYVSGDEQ